jgi:hypothetical protein
MKGDLVFQKRARDHLLQTMPSSLTRRPKKTITKTITLIYSKHYFLKLKTRLIDCIPHPSQRLGGRPIIIRPTYNQIIVL